MDQNQMLSRITQANRRDVMQLLNFLNFEIEYILRPRSAPARYIYYKHNQRQRQRTIIYAVVHCLQVLFYIIFVLKQYLFLVEELPVYALIVVLKVQKEVMVHNMDEG